MIEPYEKCPYCGDGIGKILKYGDFYIVKCGDCGFLTHRCFDTPEEAAEDWDLEIHDNDRYMEIHDDNKYLKKKPDFSKHAGQHEPPDDYPN